MIKKKKNKYAHWGRNRFALFSAPFIGVVAGKHTHTLTYCFAAADSGASTPSVFLRKENGATGEFLRTNGKTVWGPEHKHGPFLWGPVTVWGTTLSERIKNVRSDSKAHAGLI